MAAILGEIEFSSDLGNACSSPRVAGILAHANEERQTMSAMRRIDPVNHVYARPPRREPLAGRRLRAPGEQG